MKLQIVLIAVVVVYLTTVVTSTYSQEAHPDTAFLPLEDVAPAEHHQAESFLEPNEGLVRNKRQFGYGGYGGGYGGGFRRGGYGGYGGGGYGRGGYGGFRGGYGGYGR